MLLEKLKIKAIEKGLLEQNKEIDAERAFLLVRDMPYERASDRESVTIINEWRGTCSGKHYLLKDLFAELGYESRVIACTTISYLDPKRFYGKMRKLLRKANGKFVDVHNYLVLELPEGDMIVDATFPISTSDMDLIVNEQFVLGEDQRIADEPIQSWDVPDHRDPQEFKDEILKESFSTEELEYRDEMIIELSKLTNSKFVKILVWLEKIFRGNKTK